MVPAGNKATRDINTVVKELLIKFVASLATDVRSQNVALSPDNATSFFPYSQVCEEVVRFTENAKTAHSLPHMPLPLWYMLKC